jgi:tetratricopeptide (TPR) repeat protein
MIFSHKRIKQLLLLSVCLGLCLPAFSQSFQATIRLSILEDIQAAMQKKDWQGALALFKRFTPEDAANTGIQVVKATLYVYEGDMEAASSVVDTILDREPYNSDALYIKSFISYGQGGASAEQAVLEAALQKDPNNDSLLVKLANSWLSTREANSRALSMAESYYEAALGINPLNVDALIGLASTFRYKATTDTERENALSLLDLALELSPNSSAALQQRGNLLRSLGEYRRAEADLAKAAKLEPENYYILCDYGNVLIDCNETELSLSQFSAAAALDPSNFLAYTFSASLRSQLGDNEGAKRDLISLTTIRPDYYYGWANLGYLYMQDRQWTEAKNAYGTAYQYSPSSGTKLGSDETAYALMAVAAWTYSGKDEAQRKSFIQSRINRAGSSSNIGRLLRIYLDKAGDNNIVLLAERVTEPLEKFRLYFYLGLYYDIKGLPSLKDEYFNRAHSLFQNLAVEWRYLLVQLGKLN